MSARTARRLAAASALALGAASLGALALGAAPGRRASRAGGDADSAAFVAAARDGTRRYASQQEAIDDGFTRVGGEFPAMGEHWVSFARVMDDTLDARRPSILIYANTAAGPRLAGVAYTKLVAVGAAPPAFPHAGAWHPHDGAVSEESLPAAHGHRHEPSAAAGGAPSLYVLHAWVWTPNPDGTFVTDNWALPLARLGVDRPGPHPRDADRATALAADSAGYYRATLRESLGMSDREDSLAAAALDAGRAGVAPAADGVRAEGRLSAERAARLAAGWDSLWAELAAALPARAAALRRLRGEL